MHVERRSCETPGSAGRLQKTYFWSDSQIPIDGIGMGGGGGAVSPLTGTIWNSGAREKKGHNLEIRLGDEVGDTLGCTHRKRYFVIFAPYDIYFGKTIHLAALHI